MSFRNYFSKVRTYYPFSRSEILTILLTIVALAFIYSFDLWGTDSFSAQTGFSNLTYFTFIIGVVLLVHHSGQRLYAVSKGYSVKQKLWWHGLVAGLLTIKFMGASGTITDFHTRHRLGAMRFGPNLKDIAKICLAGPMSNIFFAALVYFLSLIYVIPHVLAVDLINVSLLFAAWNMLPIPPLDGFKVMYSSRHAFGFLFGSIVGYAVLFFMFGISSVILAAITGILGVIFVIKVVEK